MFVIREASTCWSRFQHSRRYLDTPFTNTAAVTAGPEQEEKDTIDFNVQYWDIVSAFILSMPCLIIVVPVLLV
jgi:hypothetical protein